MPQKIYRNSTEVAQLHGVPILIDDVVKSCLYGRLNLFLQGNTGDGKTQLAKDAMSYFGDRSLFVLGRNDMETRELFQQINLGKLYGKPVHNLEPLVNPATGAVEYFYPQFDEQKGIFVQKRLSGQETETVRKTLEQLAGNTGTIRELTSKINTNIIVVDEMPNCVPAVRAQLFNLFDGFIEINGKAYAIGTGMIAYGKDGKSARMIHDGTPMSEIESMKREGFDVRSDAYSVGIATGNIGQKFTESSNDLGRALKDRMHVIIDTDHFYPQASDTLNILAGDTNPRVAFSDERKDESAELRAKYREVCGAEVPLEKLMVANYLLHGLDHCSKGSKRRMKDKWPNELEQNEIGSDVSLVLPSSTRAAKSVIRLSQALDEIARSKGVKEETISTGHLDSMLTAYKLVAAYSGVLNEAAVDQIYGGNKYAAMDAVTATTRTQFEEKKKSIAAGVALAGDGKTSQKVMNDFTGRWEFMRGTLEELANQNKPEAK
ncbi:MAG: AAA family ATPase [Nanoarchaeota archaeon]|nr:AAA family ATPase [Nanoarchaeota archaeon]